MKKVLTVILVLLIIGVVAGITGTVIYSAKGGIMQGAEKKTVKIDYSGEDLSIETYFDKIEVEVAFGNQITFEYYESEKVKRTIENEEGEISFETEAPRFFNRFIGNKYVLKIGVPKLFSGKLEIESETGSVLLDLNSVTCKEIDVEVTTGDLTIKNASCTEACSLEATTGSIVAKDIEAGASVNVKVTTGSVTVDKLSAKEVKIKLTTGSLKEGKIEGKQKDFNVETSTTTGKSNLINQTVVDSDKLIQAKTTTGDIKIEFTEE